MAIDRSYQPALIASARLKLRSISQDLKSRGIERKPRLMVQLAAGGGKCLAYDTPVLMYDGKVKPVQDIKVGDQLIGPDSQPRNVLSLARGREMMYRITPTKGDAYVVNASHILSLRKQPLKSARMDGRKRRSDFTGDKIINIRADDAYSRPATFLKSTRGWRSGADFGEEKLWLDPYFLGLWLGDGHSNSVTITTGDTEVKDYLKDMAVKTGVHYAERYNSANSVIACLTTGKGQSNPLVDTLRRLRVFKNKHVPHVVKLMNRQDRLEFLAGYIDADGSHNGRGGFDAICKDQTMMNDISFVARSLGFASYVTECRKTCTNNGVSGTYYRCSITGHTNQIPCKVARKQAGPRKINKNVLTVGISIEPIGEGDYYGFAIDGDHLFLLGDFTVTHNTMLSAMMAAAALEKQGRVAFLCHRDYLLFQTSNTYKDMGIRHSYLAAGKTLNPRAKTHIGMIGSLKSRQHKIEAPSIAFSDEAHHGVATTWKEAIEKWPDTTFIGLSATPGARSDGKGLDEIYDGIVCGPSVAELIALGALSDYRWFQGRPPAELMALKLSKADSADKQAEILDKPVIIGDMVGNYKQKAFGKKAVYFAPNVKMSMDLAEAFTAAGCPFEHMDAHTEDWKRKSIAKAVARGELMGFTNVAIAGEGFDLAAQAGMDVTIEVTGLCRKTQSLPLLIQMAMRCMRAKDEPGYIFDHCDNYSEHGWLPDDDIEWTLQGAIRKPRETKPVQCPHCLATGYPEGHTCTNCGGNVSEPLAKAAARAQMEVIEGELVELRKHEAQQAAATEAAVKHAKKLEEWSCKTYNDWLTLATRRNYQNPQVWASKRFQLKQKRRA